MTFAQFYAQYVRDCNDMGADVCHSPGEDMLKTMATHQIIDLLVTGKLGVGDVGEELAQRNVLDQVPGDTWGY